MRNPFRRRTEARPEPNADDLGRLAELSEQMAIVAEEWARQCVLLQEAVKAASAPAIRAFDNYEAVANQWLVLADTFGLKERHEMRAALQIGRDSLAYFRGGDNQSVEWPDEIPTDEIDADIRQ